MPGYRQFGYFGYFAGTSPPPPPPPGSPSSYFGGRYFGARYWGARYWASAAAAPSGLLVPAHPAKLGAAAQAAIVGGFLVPSPAGGLAAIAARAVNLAIDRRPFPDQVPQVLVVPGPSRPVDAVVDGAGRHCPERTGQITVVYIARHARDKAGTANYQLASIYAATQQVDDLLTSRFLMDDAGNQVTTTPLRLVSGGTPSLYGDSFEFSGTDWTWEFEYLADLTIGSGD